MEKIITLIMAVLMTCSGFVGAGEKPASDENGMQIGIVNETDDCYFRFWYGLCG